MNTKGKEYHSIRIMMAVIMSTVMGVIASFLVAQNPNANIPAFPVFCLFNVTESIVVGVFIAIFIPLDKLSNALVSRFNIKNYALHGMVYAIPLSIGNGILVSGIVIFVNVFMSYLRINPANRPPLLGMWTSSWFPILLPMIVISYVVSLVFTPLVIKFISTINRNTNNEKKLKFFQVEVLVIFAAVIVAITIVMDLVIVEKSKATIKGKVSDLVAANSRQIELNIDSYLERMKTTPSLLFSDKAYYEYDATDNSIDTYDKVKNEELIKNRIVDIGLMNNYSDFGIIYSDNHKVGWISNGTQNLYSDGDIYNPLSELIGDNPDQEAWGFGINGDIERIYYLKRVNEHAILVSSVYTRELSSVFVYPEQLDNIDIWLTDKDGRIIFSSKANDIGDIIPEYIDNAIGHRLSQAGASSAITTKQYFINVNICANGWNVICAVPADIVLKETKNLRTFTIRISVLMSIIFVLAGLLIINRISEPIDDMVSSLQYKAEVDKLSGVMNKATFQEETEKRLFFKENGEHCAFIMMDMDNFKLVNDKHGHSYGDQVIIKFGKMLRGLFDEDTLIGRLGGDEFAIFIEAGKDNNDKEGLEKRVTEGLNLIMERFEEVFKEEKEDCKLSVSAGVYYESGEKPSFSEIYEKADVALYQSKHAGKSRYTVYTEGSK